MAKIKHVVVVTELREEKIVDPLKETDLSIRHTEARDWNPTFRYPELLFRLTYIWITDRPDVILSHSDGIASFISVLISIITRTPTIIRLGGDPWKTNKMERSEMWRRKKLKKYCIYYLKRILFEITFRYSSGFLIVASSIRESILSNTGCEPENIKLIPVPRHQPKDSIAVNKDLSDKTVILTVTNLNFKSKYLGVKHIFESLYPILENKRDFLYIIAGGGQYYSDLVKDINNIFADSSVRWKVNAIGYVNNISYFYGISDIFVYNSGLDGMPNVLLESQSWGIPVLTNNSFGVADYADKRNAETGIIEYSNSKDFRRIFECLYSSKGYRENIGGSGKEYISEHHSNYTVGIEIAEATTSIICD